MRLGGGGCGYSSGPCWQTALTACMDREFAPAYPCMLRHIRLFRSQEVFDEAQYLDELLEGLYGTTDELAAVFDYAAACFPPSYDIFNRVFSVYHVQVWGGGVPGRPTA